MAGDDSSKKGDSSSSDLNLVFGDPLYLHPNDTNGTPIMTVKLTGTENYKVWSIAITFALRNHNKIGFIDGTCEKDNTNLVFPNQWDMYTYDKVDGSAVFNLHKSIISLSQNGASLANYYNNLNSLWKQFDAIFFMGLYDNYLAIRSNILNREPLPLVKVSFAIVSGEESHRNITSSGATKPNAFVFAAKTFDKKRHIVDRCFKILGYPAGYVKRNFIPNSKPVTNNNTIVDPPSNKASSNTNSNSPVSLSIEQLTRLMNLLNDNGVSTANANMSGKNFMNIKGIFFNGSVKFNLNFKRFFNGNTDFVVGNISLGWIVDSGANQHMTVSTKNLVNVVDISNLGLTVGHPNGTQALITKIGDLKINNNITLNDVLDVPEYTVSLLSVHKLSRDNKLFVGFNESNCYIQDLKANKILGIGRQFNGLYLFDVDNACKIVSNSCISTCFVSKTLWHQRLGHPADPVFHAFKDTFNLDIHYISDHLYDTSNKAKQTRGPFL
ncbi:ribonuclease H-like domain-containing protein [Tanacetum coccineum]